MLVSSLMLLLYTVAVMAKARYLQGAPKRGQHAGPCPHAMHSLLAPRPWAHDSPPPGAKPLERGGNRPRQGDVTGQPGDNALNASSRGRAGAGSAALRYAPVALRIASARAAHQIELKMEMMTVMKGGAHCIGTWLAV